MQGLALQSDNGFFNLSAPAWQMENMQNANISSVCPGIKVIDSSQLPLGNYSTLLTTVCGKLSAIFPANASMSDADNCLINSFPRFTSGQCEPIDKSLGLLIGGLAAGVALTILYFVYSQFKDCQKMNTQERSALEVNPAYRVLNDVEAARPRVAVTIGAGAGAYTTYQELELDNLEVD
ncbi:MAG: hypothetical protein K0R66_912 [Gammaproteobacteria bacterium]|jgi:hypothetical protein|nr:hypothetical protein [Gammaproteobacteria bacterium]